MKLKKNADKRIVFRDIYLLILSILVILVISIKSSLSNYILLVVIISFLKNYDAAVLFDNSYIYLLKKEKKISPLKDKPIKLSDVIGYKENNPFPDFNRWCKSSKNLTVYFANGEYSTFSVKSQEMLIDLLKQNNISYMSKRSVKAIIEHVCFTIVNCLLIFFFLYKTTKNYSDLYFCSLLVSILCFIYWIIYFFTGIFIKKRLK